MRSGSTPTGSPATTAKLQNLSIVFKDLINNTVHKLKSSLLRPQRPYVRVNFGKSVVNALYDTGADITCMNVKQFRKLYPIGTRPKKIEKKTITTGATGAALESAGIYELPFEIDGRKITFPVHVYTNLGEKMILGIDLIHKNNLGYDPSNQSLYWADKNQNWSIANLQCAKNITIEAMTVKVVTLNVITERNYRIATPGDAIAAISCDEHIIQGGPAMVRINKLGQTTMEIFNCTSNIMSIEKNTRVGICENLLEEDVMQEVNVNTMTVTEQDSVPREELTAKKRKWIEENAQLNVPEQYKEEYMKVLLENHDVISSNKYDLGKCSTSMHDIELKTKDPIYIKQFRIPEAQRQAVQDHVDELLKLGVVRPSRSKYNSPIFIVSKKGGGIRIVQDFRAINTQTLVDKYSMRDVQECIDEIGRAGSKIFSTIDLTSGFWQMMLNPECRKFTAFTLPGLGQFEWNASPMGLLGAPGSFQRLMEIVIHNLKNVLAYIDDLLLHTKDHKQHLEILKQLFARLRKHGLKINLPKSFFGATDVSYLGFKLTPDGIKPGTDKLKAVAAALPPKNIHEVRQFLGLCNFFRGHVRNFAQITAPLNRLTTKTCEWKKGPLPEDASKAFEELKTILCSEPIINYPQADLQYALITDACQGDSKHPGGFGAILAQIRPDGEFQVVSYASRKLKDQEKNYAPFLLEMTASVWAMDHYDVYLKGRRFILFTDHKPLVKIGSVHTKTLNRMQEAMLTYDFEIRYQKGSEMPADFLSRNVVELIQTDNETLQKNQNKEEWIREIKAWMLNGTPCKNKTAQNAMKNYWANKFFIEDDLLWTRFKYKGEPSRVCLVIPRNMVGQTLKDAHGTLFSGHEGIAKTRARITQNYWWPAMDGDIANFIKTCGKCQKTRTDIKQKPDLLTPLPICTEPNQRIHADLFGALKTSGKNKKFVLTITDAFTKYAELVAIPNKEAETVADAIFSFYICRYGIPVEIITDQGKEFCNKLSDELFKLMEMKHGRTSPYHPQCNAQAEVGNKTIRKYLQSFVEPSTFDWELLLAPLMFVYNTSFHRTIQTSPYFLTYGQQARQPAFNQGEWQKKCLGESSAAEKFQILQQAREVAWRNSIHQQEVNREIYDRQAAPHQFKKDQWVLLKKHNFLNKNKKLAENYEGPYQIVKLKPHNTIELKLNRKSNLIVHANNLKPYHDQTNFEQLEDELEEEEEKLEKPEPDHQPEPETEQPKRKRGRPRKTEEEKSAEKEKVKPPTLENFRYNLRSKKQIENLRSEDWLMELEKAEKAVFLIKQKINFITWEERLKTEEMRRHPFIKEARELIKNCPPGYIRANYPSWNDNEIINYWWSGDINEGPDEIGFSLSDNPYLPPSVQFGGIFAHDYIPEDQEEEPEFHDLDNSSSGSDDDFDTPPGTPQASTSSAATPASSKRKTTGATGTAAGGAGNVPSPSTSGKSKYDLTKVRKELQKADYKKAKTFKNLNPDEENFFKHQFFYAKMADKELKQEEGRPTRSNPAGIRTFLQKK